MQISPRRGEGFHLIIIFIINKESKAELARFFIVSVPGRPLIKNDWIVLYGTLTPETGLLY
ncbi:hypothetical protein AY555_00330 [Haematospirillum jordaniae]|uniref:Uncharacterized protein n=1 Tax=Haematospirillum jordaniae TaxID=1549855 RepID=A0A143DBH7_9PROT|nr:hypothetical protein AY555_00330 [Haematospirillum jordaniae]